MRSLATGLTLAALLLGAGSATANDAVFGGRGSDLVPVKETRVRMASEDILLELVPKKPGARAMQWKVTATYQFENPAEQPAALTVGFPERFCEPEGGDCDSPDGKTTFQYLQTTVAGKRVQHRVGTVAEGTEWAPELGRVHLFDATLPANATVEIVHRYVMGRSYTAMGDDDVSYVTKTGALWGGPIGKATFTIRTPERPWSLGWPKDFRLQRMASRPVDKGAVTEIIFQMEQWTPKQDLEVVLGGAMEPFGKCPSVLAAASNTKGPATDLAAAKEQFSGLTAAELRVCRNLPYAHHGYTFKDQKLTDLFYGSAKPSTSPWSYGIGGDGAPDYLVARFQPNRTYDPKLLTADEQVYVRMVKALEADVAKGASR